MKKILLSHPSKQHSYKVANALNELGYLEKFVTNFYISNKKIQEYIKRNNNEFLMKKFEPGLFGDKIDSLDFFEEMASYFNRHIKKKNNSYVSSDTLFDLKLSNRLHKYNFDVFWGYQGSSFESIKKANELGKQSIVEMTTAYLPFAQNIMAEEILLSPEWEDSIDFANKLPQDYIDRQTEEPKLAKKVISISNFLTKTLIDNGIDKEKILYQPLGFDIKHILYQKDIIPIENRPLRLLFVGKIGQRKGVKYLLESIKKFSKKRVELHFIGNIHGSGVAFERYNNFYEYHGSLSQQSLFKKYTEFDAFVFPSLCEGFPLALIEAMGAGLPVITTNNTSASELIKDDVNGYIIPIRSVDGIAEAIEKLLFKSTEELSEMRSAAREAALVYTWDTYKKRLEHLIMKV